MKLIVARHGQTRSNRDGMIMGQSDSLLTREGAEAIPRVAGIIANEAPGAVFASTLGRAAYTASIISLQLGVPIHFRSSMAELSCGRWEGGPRTLVETQGRSLRNTWAERPPEGESYQDAEQRVASFIQEIHVRANAPGRDSLQKVPPRNPSPKNFIAVANSLDRYGVQGTPSSKGALVEQASCLLRDGGQDARPTREEELSDIIRGNPYNVSAVSAGRPLSKPADKTSSILVVGHASVNRVLLKLWLGLEPETAIGIVSPHDMAYIIEEEGRVRYRSADGTEGSGLILDSR